MQDWPSWMSIVAVDDENMSWRYFFPAQPMQWAMHRDKSRVLVDVDLDNGSLSKQTLPLPETSGNPEAQIRVIMGIKIPFGIVGRKLQDFRRVRHYIVISRNGETRYCYSGDSVRLLVASTALATARRRTRLVRLFWAVVIFSGVQISGFKMVIASRIPSPLENWLCRKLAVPEIRLAYSVGTPGAYRKYTVQVMDPETGTILAYLKVSHTLSAREMVYKEMVQLQDLMSHPTMAAQVPRVLGHFSEEHILAVLLSAGPGFLGPKRFSEAHIDFLKSLGSDVLTFGTFKESAFRDRLLQKVNEIGDYGRPNGGETFRMLIGQLESRFGSVHIPYIRVHGDFTPWNTQRTRSGELFVFDWEFSERSSLPLIDLFHFSAFPLLLKGLGGNGELWTQYQNKWTVIAAKLGVSEPLVLPLYCCYLIDILLFYLLAMEQSPQTGNRSLIVTLWHQLDSVTQLIGREVHYGN